MDNNEYKNYEQKPDEFTTVPNEFSSDFIVETSNVNTTEMPEIPEEYAAEPQNEQVATRDYNDFENAYKPNEEDYDYDAETAEEIYDNYDVESADDKNNAYDRELENDYDYYNDVPVGYVDPKDEQAAVKDDDYSYACERCKLDDYEIISDVLGAEKQIVKLYSTALCEAAEDNFRNVIKENLDYAAEDQYKAFEFMSTRGMYKTEQASENDVNQAKQQFAPLTENSGCSHCNPDYEHCRTDSECGSDGCEIDYDNCNCVDCSCEDPE